MMIVFNSYTCYSSILITIAPIYLFFKFTTKSFLKLGHDDSTLYILF